VTRANLADPQSHVVVGAQSYKPKDSCAQMSLNPNHGWGVLKHLCDVCMRLEDGKYVILKDPMKGMLRIYRVPIETFEEEEEVDDDFQEVTTLVE
jgi:translation initiation factor 3 subunit D